MFTHPSFPLFLILLPVSIFLPPSRPTYLLTCLPTYQPAYLPTYLPTYRRTYLSHSHLPLPLSPFLPPSLLHSIPHPSGLAGGWIFCLTLACHAVGIRVRPQAIEKVPKSPREGGEGGGGEEIGEGERENLFLMHPYEKEDEETGTICRLIGKEGEEKEERRGSEGGEGGERGREGGRGAEQEGRRK
jgi:hypothetical protein